MREEAESICDELSGEDSGSRVLAVESKCMMRMVKDMLPILWFHVSNWRCVMARLLIFGTWLLVSFGHGKTECGS